MKKGSIILTALAAACLLVSCGSQKLEEVTVVAQPIEDIREEDGDPGEESREASEEPEGIRSYLTGLPVEEEQQKKRPVAVMLNNIREGCPQAGIGEASVVYEAPVEGRITRLMGLFEDWTDKEKIGYVRSSRDYFVYCALEHDAIYCHFGQATPYVGELLNSDRVDNISAAVAGIDRPAQHAFSRTDDRPVPHNVITTGPDILEDAERFGYRLEYHDTFQPKFTFDGDTASLYEDAPAVSEIYPGGKGTDEKNGYSRVGAHFQWKDGKYYRFQYGGAQIDELTGSQLAYENVILQYCNGEVRDKNDYLAFGCHGDDGFPVQVFTGGRMVSGTWSRYGDNDPAVYVDENGEKIRLTPGKTWICIVWMDYAGDVELE